MHLSQQKNLEFREDDTIFHGFRFPGMLEARICTGMGLPVPEPPQLLQVIFPEPQHVLHPTSLSDHLVHRQGTFRVPLHVAHCLPPAMGFCSSASKIDFTIHAPAMTDTPCTTCTTTPGDIVARLRLMRGTKFAPQSIPKPEFDACDPRAT